MQGYQNQKVYKLDILYNLMNGELIAPKKGFKSLYIITPLFLIAFMAVLAVMIAPTYTTNLNNVEDMSDPVATLQYGSRVCITTTGDFEGRKSPAHQGIEELVQCDHNLVHNSGLEAIEDSLSVGGSAAAFTYIALCNSTGTASCNDSVASETNLPGEHTAFGLARAAGTAGSNGASSGNWSVFKTFTATSAATTNKTGLFNASTGDTILASNTFTAASLQPSDTLTVNWTLYVTSG